MALFASRSRHSKSNTSVSSMKSPTSALSAANLKVTSQQQSRSSSRSSTSPTPSLAKGPSPQKAGPRQREARRPRNAATDLTKEGKAMPSSASEESDGQQKKRQAKLNASPKRNKRPAKAKPLAIPNAATSDLDSLGLADMSSHARSAPSSSFVPTHRAHKSISGLPPRPISKSEIKANAWDMPATPRKQEALTWQQTLLSSSQSRDDSTLRSNTGSKENQPDQPRMAMFGIQNNQTWQQAMLGTSMDITDSPVPASRPSPKKNKGSANSINKRSRRPASTQALVGVFSHTASESDSGPLSNFGQLQLTPTGNEQFEMDDVFTAPPSSAPAQLLESPKRNRRSGKHVVESTSKAGLLTRSQSETSTDAGLSTTPPPSGPSSLSLPPLAKSPFTPGGLPGRYAGPNFHNSPNAANLPAPSFSKRTSLVV